MSSHTTRHCAERSDESIQPHELVVDCFAALAMTALAQPSVQLLDRHRNTLPDADAHRRQRAIAAALLHAVHRGHREPGAAHAERVTQRNGAAVRVDEIGILLDAELA